MSPSNYTLTPAGIERFNDLQLRAVEEVTMRFYAVHGPQYAQFGARGRRACRQDIEFHLQFLRPVLELGDLQPFLEYLRWFDEVLTTRRIPSVHIQETLLWLGQFFQQHMPGANGEKVAAALTAATMAMTRPAEPVKVNSSLPTNLAATEYPADSVVSPPPNSDPVMQAESLHGYSLSDSPRTEADFESALIQGDRRYCLTAVNRLLDQGRSSTWVNVNLIQPALINIGLKWQRNQVTVAQEHLATATAQAIMADTFSRTALPEPLDRKAIFACTEGNHHSVGLRMVADAFEFNGWNVQFLGANTPTEALKNQIKTWCPDLIGLSIAFAHQLGNARDAIKEIRSQMGKHCPHVIVGGRTVNRLPGAVQLLDADGLARDALAAQQYAFDEP